jgi:hypothetical protein
VEEGRGLELLSAVMWKRSVLLFALAGTLAAGACGDGEVGPTTTTPAPASTGSSSTSTQTPSAPVAVGTFRACHKRRDGSIVLVILFENRNRSLLGGFEGALAFQVSPVDPTTWSTTGGDVKVDPGRNPHIRQITVPSAQPAPAEVKLSVTTTAAVDPTNVLGNNHVTIAVPATSCTSA